MTRKIDVDFDPWTASFDEAMKANDRGQFGVADPTAPLYQWASAQVINARKQEVDGGSGFAVLACIRDCVTRGLVAPEWLAYAFNRRYDAVLHCRAKSWDDPKSFGRPYPKGAQLAAMRKRSLGRLLVWNKAMDILRDEPRPPIDEAFFERIGREIRPPIGKTEASELYYQAKRMFGRR